MISFISLLQEDVDIRSTWYQNSFPALCKVFNSKMTPRVPWIIEHTNLVTVAPKLEFYNKERSVSINCIWEEGW